MHFSARLGLAFVALLTTSLAENVGEIREVGLSPEVTGDLSSFNRDLAINASALNIDLREHFTIEGVNPDQLVQIKTNFGTINAELLVADAPLTVANFRSYLATDSTSAANQTKTYDNTIFHRSVPGFVIQGGGMQLTGDLAILAEKPKVQNEFKVANTRGTLAMAKIGPAEDAEPTPETINSATNQWFINLDDNRDILDNQNGGFTAFARVLGNGMDAADAIAALPRYDLFRSPYFSGFFSTHPQGAAFDEVPLKNYNGSDNLLLSSFAVVQSARILPLQPPVKGMGDSVINYTLVNTNPAVAKTTLLNGRLRVLPTKTPGRSVLTVRASEAGGAFVESTLTLTRVGPPAIVTQLPSTSTKPFGTVATLAADTSIWPVGTIRWERKPAGSATFTPIAEDDPLFTGETTTDLKIALNDATAPAATFAALQNNQFRYVLTNALGTTTSKPTTLKITTLKVGFSAHPAPIVNAQLGATASFTVTALAVASNTPLTYRWERLPPGSKTPVTLVNSTEEAPTPFSGATTRTLKVKLDDLELNGSQFRCVISNALQDAPPPVAATGVATSKPGILRVIADRRTVVTAESEALFGLVPGDGVSFSARGLPKGLVLASGTGVLSGTAAVKPGLYSFSVTTTTPSGKTTRTYHIEILGLSGNSAGGFEAFLSPDADALPPTAKLALLIAPNGTFTGTLGTSEETKPFALKGAVVRDLATGRLSLQTALVLKRPGTPAGRVYLLDFEISSAGVLSASLQTRETVAAAPVDFAMTDDENLPGVQLGSFTRTPYGNNAPWARATGAYTLAFTDATPLAADPLARVVPAGTGYATAMMFYDGLLMLTGKTGDGVKFTAALSTSESGSYRLFVRNQHGGAPGAFLAANLVLTKPTINSTRYSIAVADRDDAYWAKPALLKSANYAAGFGPLGLTVRMEPWSSPSYADLGMAGSGANQGKLVLRLLGETTDNTGANPRGLPLGIVMSDTGGISSTLANDPSELTGQLNFANGSYSATFKITDTVMIKGNPKNISRTVKVEGVFLTLSAFAADTVVGEGLVTTPALNPATGSTKGPVTTDRIQLRSLAD